MVDVRSKRSISQHLIVISWLSHQEVEEVGCGVIITNEAAVRVTQLDVFKDTWGHFQLFVATKTVLFFTGSWTICIHDGAKQNMYFKPNHDVFPTL